MIVVQNSFHVLWGFQDHWNPLHPIICAKSNPPSNSMFNQISRAKTR